MSQEQPKKKRSKTQRKSFLVSKDISQHCTAADVANKPLDVSSDTLLQDMIHPIALDEFLSDIFRQKALYVSAGGEGGQRRVEGIIDQMHGLDPEHILRETSSDNVFVWLRNPSPDDGNRSRIHSMEIENVEQAIQLHKLGNHATYCRAPPDVEQPMVYHLLRGTGMGCGNYDPSGIRSQSLGRGEVEVFMGTENHVTNFHTDFQENFTLQLSGVKRWTLYHDDPNQTVSYPLRGCTPHYAAPEAVESQLKAARLSNAAFHVKGPGKEKEASFETVWMRAGDMLYFPAGMWHKVETIEPGVSINVSLMATNYANVTCQALQHLLLREECWRETIVGSPCEVSRKLRSLLRELPATIEAFVGTHDASSTILSPALLVPPTLVLDTSTASESWQDVDNIENKDDPATNNGLGEGNDANNHNKMDDDDEGEGEAIDIGEIFGAPTVEASSFTLPPGFQSVAYHPNKFVLNPLADVFPLRDLAEHFDVNPATLENHWFLNVNYAGNELHESAIRVLLKDETGPLQLSDNDSCCNRFDCFRYYGLYVPRSSS